MSDDELWRRTATDLAAAIAAREVSCVEVMQAHLARIEAVNPVLNAIVTLDAELALREAAAADRSASDGAPGPALRGLPIAIKDLEDTAGMRTTYGSPIYRDHVPTQDTLLVARLRRAGAIVIGKTNTPEFGAGSQTFNPVFGPTRNPYDRARTPGGSSGGAAAAVAGGMLPFADGSDLGREHPQPRVVLQPHRAADVARPGARPCPPRTCGARSACAARWRGPRRTPRCCCGRWPARTRARRCRSTSRPTAWCSAPAWTRAACGSHGAPTSATSRSRPRWPPCSSEAAARWRRWAARSRRSSLTSAGPTRPSRSCAPSATRRPSAS